jgi:5'-3' exonuclease
MGADTPERKTRAALIGLTQAFLGLVARAGEPPTTRRGGVALDNGVTGAVIAFDEGRALRRRSIYPAYQTGREVQGAFLENEPFVTAGIRQFIDAVATLPMTVLQGTNTEADDLIAAYTLATEEPVRIASSDRDFYQLIGPRVSIYSPIKKIVIGDANFAEMVLPKGKDGSPLVFPHERFVDFRALCGDTSDDLPGLPGAGPVTAAQMLAFAPLDDFLANPALLREATGRSSKKLEAALGSDEGRAIIERNRKLMDLREGATSPTSARYRGWAGGTSEPSAPGWRSSDWAGSTWTAHSRLWRG